jgi:hypothetical protein
MKKIILFFIVTLCTVYSSFSQEDIATNLENPGGKIIIDDFLYFVQKIPFGGGKLSRISITQENPTVEDLYIGFNDPVELVYNAPNLYLLELQGGLYKIDMSKENLQPIFVIDPTGNSSNRSRGLAVINNYAYISLIDENKIVKVDLNASFPTNYDDYITGVNFPNNLASKENTLFFTNKISGVFRLEKINVNDPNQSSTIIENNLGNVTDFKVVDDIIYVLHYASSFKGVSKIILSNTLPTHSEPIISGLPSSLTSLAIANNSIYVSQHINPGGRIIEYNTGTLSVDDYMKSDIELFPNPAENSVFLKSDTNPIQSISLFSITGKKVLSHKVKDYTVEIPVQGMARGIYILHAEINNTQLIKKLILK